MRITTGAAAVLLATAGAALAADAPVAYGPPVIVTATRFNERPDTLPVGVTVVTAEEIQRSPVRSIQELLSKFAGIHVRDNTGGADPQIDMRGFGITGDQNTLILVNGQRLSENELVSAALSAIPVNAIERIEIMRGSGSVLYGGGATGGTINIITRAPRPGQRSALLFGGGGTYDTAEARATGIVSGENVGISLSASQLESDNYRVNNHLRQRGAEIDARFGDASRHVSVKLGGDDQDLRNPGARTSAQLVTDRRGATTPDDFSSRSGARINLDAGWRVGESELAASFGYRDREAKANQFFFGAPTTTTTQVSTWQLTPRARVPFVLGGLRNTLVAGMDFDDWDYDSVFQGGFFNSHALATQRNRALYLQDNLELTPATRLTFGGRLQRSENVVTDLLPAATSAEQTRTPRAYELALRQQIDPGASVYGKIGRSFRIATVDENRFQVTLLEPQTSRDMEAGAELAAGPVRLRAAVFQMRLENEIYFSPLFPPFGANVNLAPTRRRGLELDSSWAVSGALSVFANFALTSAEFRSGAYGGTDVSGNDVPLVPARTLAAGGSWRFARGADLSLFARYVGTQRFDNDQANTFMTMPTYTTVNARLGYQTGGWLLAATVLNLTDKQYFSYGIRNAAGTDFNAYPAAERAIFVSAQYSFQ
jgi:iron complex outermembrane receptor protein